MGSEMCIRDSSYTFDYLSGYLRHRADLDLLLVVLGDHQPPASVSGERTRWDVPVHIIASRREALAPLLDAGFVLGLEPHSEAIGPMHELTTLLLRAVSGSDQAAREGEGASWDQPRRASPTASLSPWGTDRARAPGRALDNDKSNAAR